MRTEVRTNLMIDETKGAIMGRKVSIICALALAVTVLGASVAYAAVGDSGFNWDPNRGTNSGTGTPHIGFSTTTYKCGVCHMVHGQVAAGEVLLPDTVANACNACHLDGANSIKDVYQSNPANWTTDTRANHSSAGDYNLKCTGCHVVHGAGAVTAAGWTEYILNAGAGTLPGGQAVPNGDLATGTDASAVLSRYCSQCHTYYTGNYDADAVERHHVMKAAGSTYNNSKTVFATSPGTVAAAGSEYCTSCHDIAGASVSSATAAAVGFPHNVPNVDRFMKVADYYGATATSASLATTQAESDGACIKCHIWSNGNLGVGKSY